MWWALGIVGVLAAVGLIVLVREARNAPWYDEETNRYYKTFEELINARNKANMEKQLLIVVFTLPQDIVMHVPVASIARIDGSVLVFERNAPDYLLIRNHQEELAPAVTTNIAEAIITFI